MNTPQPWILTDNLWSRSLYPSHVISANEAASDRPARFVGNGRRSASNYWTPTTANNDAWNKVTCNRLRAADSIVIDRGHNLAGKTVALQCSNDDFTTTETVFSITMPSASMNNHLDNYYGVRTEEGAWCKRFSERYAKYWRLYVTAGGSGYLPRVVGLFVGKSWSPPVFDYPWAEDDAELGGEVSESDAGWEGMSAPWNRREGTLNVRLNGELDYDLARLWVAGFYGQRALMWLLYDDAQADRAVCAVRPRGLLGWRLEENWLHKRRAEIGWREYEGKPL